MPSDDCGQFDELDAAEAADRIKHPPGLNIWGRPLVESKSRSDWRGNPDQVTPPTPLAEARGEPAAPRAGRPRWVPPPELVEAMRTRFHATGPSALAREFNVPDYHVCNLAKRMGLSMGGKRHRPTKAQAAALNSKPAPVPAPPVEPPPAPPSPTPNPQPPTDHPLFIVRSGDCYSQLPAASHQEAMTTAMRDWLEIGRTENVPVELGTLIRAHRAGGRPIDVRYWLTDSILETLAKEAT